jgi:hypothetical protein
MNDTEFQERWERDAERERARYDARPVPELVADIKAGRLGDYCQIWPSLGARATLAEVNWVLYDILQSELDQLNRYHCAQALVAIAGLYAGGVRPEELTARDRFDVNQRLAELRTLLEKKLGDRAAV